jgi:hypothetical protein
VCLPFFVRFIFPHRARAQVIAVPRPVNDNPNCDPTFNVPGVGRAELVRFVSWGEAQTLVYLKISLSDFFTVFAARCRSWCVQLATLRPPPAPSLCCPLLEN